MHCAGPGTTPRPIRSSRSPDSARSADGRPSPPGTPPTPAGTSAPTACCCAPTMPVTANGRCRHRPTETPSAPGLPPAAYIRIRGAGSPSSVDSPVRSCRTSRPVAQTGLLTSDFHSVSQRWHTVQSHATWHFLVGFEGGAGCPVPSGMAAGRAPTCGDARSFGNGVAGPPQTSWFLRNGLCGEAHAGLVHRSSAASRIARRRDKHSLTKAG